MQHGSNPSGAENKDKAGNDSERELTSPGRCGYDSFGKTVRCKTDQDHGNRIRNIDLSRSYQ